MANVLNHAASGHANDSSRSLKIGGDFMTLQLPKNDRRRLCWGADIELGIILVDVDPMVAANTTMLGRHIQTASPRWEAARLAVAQWKSLPLDWDGSDTPMLAPLTLDIVQALVNIGAERGLADPSPYYAADGEVGLRWNEHQRRAIISFKPNGEIVALLVAAGVQPIKINSSDEWRSMAETFLSTIKAVFR